VEEKKKKPEAPKEQAKTLFIRNISYETTKEDLKEYMERFGDVKYAVLVKARELQGKEGGEAGHRGTGFVQFKDPKAAEQLLALSKQIEETLDKECKEQRVKSKKEGGSSSAKGVAGVI
jgi:RNA recognition motif-containing protein